MMSDAKRRAALPWVPVGLCAFLSLLTIVMNLWLSYLYHTDPVGWAIGFLCFLPMCFFFAGAATSQTQGEILELRKQIAELKGNKAPA